MTQDQTIKFGEPFWDSRGALNLNEGIWINESSLGREPLSRPPGGGGPGYGGWGLGAGRPPGTGGPSPFLREKGWRTVFGEEKSVTDRYHVEKYASALEQLPEQIDNERSNIEQHAIAGAAGNPTRHVELRQTINTNNLQQKRAEYLDILPAATGFYGAIPFYKRYDSFATRLHDQFAFVKGSSGQEWGRHIWETYNASVDAAYRLHISAQKFQALASDLPEMARQVDELEISQPNLNLSEAIERRTKQIINEQQICFDCLPNFLQQQISQSTQTADTDSLNNRLSAYISTAISLTTKKHAEVPVINDSNPNIVGPLSKPQVEALQHLVDDQATGRAGPRWSDYHRALALTESIRYLQQFSAAMTNLSQRAIIVEQLHASLSAQQAAREAAVRQQEEAARLAAEEAARQQSEAERIAAEEAARQQAEAERIAAEEAARQRAEAERIAAEQTILREEEAARQRISYVNKANLAASSTTFIPIGAATFAIEAASTALRISISAAISQLIVTKIPLAVAVLSAAWPTTLGNAERRYLISTPLSSLSPAGNQDLESLALSSSSVDLPYLLAGSEINDDVYLYVVPGGKAVAVQAATFDNKRNVYSLSLENPQRILTWTPLTPPGANEDNSTSLPLAPPGTIIYTGSRLDPITSEIESYPALDSLDQQRLIVTFPIDSGLPPILVVFRSPRYEPGTSTGKGVSVSGTWRAQASNLQGAAFPAHIADALRGIEFKNFDAFRRTFWKTVASDPELSKQFSERDLIRMRKNGNAPSVDDKDIYMSQTSFAIHHILPISENGGVYDMDNLVIVTPKVHNRIHYGEKP